MDDVLRLFCVVYEIAYPAQDKDSTYEILYLPAYNERDAEQRFEDTRESLDNLHDPGQICGYTIERTEVPGFEITVQSLEEKVSSP